MSSHFQEFMDKRLEDIPHVGYILLLDDCIITGPDDISHIKSVEMVLEQSSKFGVQLYLKKCSYMQE